MSKGIDNINLPVVRFCGITLLCTKVTLVQVQHALIKFYGGYMNIGKSTGLCKICNQPTKRHRTAKYCFKCSKIADRGNIIIRRAKREKLDRTIDTI